MATERGRWEGGGSRWWLATVSTGVALLVLVTAHMVAHHFVVQGIGGLRNYGQVLEYIGNPWIRATESLLLVIVTAHAMLGLRAVLFDMGLSSRARRLVSKGLVVLGSVTIAYGFFLLSVLAARV